MSNELTMSLQDSLKLTNNTLQAGVIQILAEESPLLDALPFTNVSGSGFTYTVQKEVPKTNFRSVGESYVPTETKLEQRTESLSILGTEAIVDTYQNQITAPLNEIMAEEVKMKVKALAYKLEQTFLFGDKDKDSKSFDGINKRVQPNMVFQTSGTVSDDLDIGVDAVLGNPNFAIMSKSMRRKLVNENRKEITYSRNEFGLELTHYGELGLIVLDDELFPDNEKESIFVVKFSEIDGITALINGGIQVNYLGQMESAPKLMTRIEAFVGLACKNDLSVAKIVTGK